MFITSIMVIVAALLLQWGIGLTFMALTLDDDASRRDKAQAYVITIVVLIAFCALVIL